MFSVRSDILTLRGSSLSTRSIVYHGTSTTCLECERLLREWNEKLDRASALTTALATGVGKMRKPEFEAANADMERATAEVKAARDTLREHQQREHAF